MEDIMACEHITPPEKQGNNDKQFHVQFRAQLDRERYFGRGKGCKWPILSRKINYKMENRRIAGFSWTEKCKDFLQLRHKFRNIAVGSNQMFDQN